MIGVFDICLCTGHLVECGLPKTQQSLNIELEWFHREERNAAVSGMR